MIKSIINICRMKKLITILLSLLTLVSYSQTELDMLVFESLNEYRIENGVEPLVFDSIVWEAAQHHSVYLSENGYTTEYVCSSGHLELELVNFSDRLNHFDVKWTGTGGECIATWSGKRTNEESVTQVIHQWDGSPSHKKGLLKTDVTRMAISIVTAPVNCDVSFIYKGKEYGNKFTGVIYFATFLVVE